MKVAQRSSFDRLRMSGTEVVHTIHRRRQHVRLQHHARSTARRSVVYRSMLVRCEVPDLHRLARPVPPLQRPPRQRNPERRGKHFWVKCQYGGGEGHGSTQFLCDTTCATCPSSSRSKGEGYEKRPRNGQVKSCQTSIKGNSGDNPSLSSVKRCHGQDQTQSPYCSAKAAAKCSTSPPEMRLS